MGLGYPLRIIAGAWVACSSLLDPGFLASNGATLILVAASAVFFGMVFVGLTWALEGCDHLTKGSGSEYHKRHVKELSKAIPNASKSDYPLRECRPVTAVWNVAMLASLALMCVILVDRSPFEGMGILVSCSYLILFAFMAVFSGAKKHSVSRAARSVSTGGVSLPSGRI